VPLTGAAAVRLYDDHVDAVHALITRRVGPDSSPDITAETFEHAMRTWDRFDRERGTERIFLYGAAVAVLRRHEDLERTYIRALRLDVSDAPNRIADPLVPGRAGAPRVVTHAANRDLLGDAAFPGTAETDAAATADPAATDATATAATDAAATDKIATRKKGDRRKPAPTVDVDDQVGRTMRAVADLPPDDRDILLLSLWESCPQSDIAQALELSVGTVRSALGRIRRDLKIAADDAPPRRRRGR